MKKVNYKCEKCNCREANFKFQKDSNTYLVKCAECGNKTTLEPTIEEAQKIEYNRWYKRTYLGIAIFFGGLFGMLIGEILALALKTYI